MISQGLPNIAQIFRLNKNSRMSHSLILSHVRGPLETRHLFKSFRDGNERKIFTFGNFQKRLSKWNDRGLKKACDLEISNNRNWWTCRFTLYPLPCRKVRLGSDFRESRKTGKCSGVPPVQWESVGDIWFKMLNHGNGRCMGRYTYQKKQT